MNKTAKRDKKEEQKKMMVRIICIALCAIMVLSTVAAVFLS